jgi:uncharacterized repeat protein (TIGR01451 family)
MKPIRTNALVILTSMVSLAGCAREHQSPSYNAAKSADIAVTGSASEGSIASGQNAVFTITVLNHGPDDAPHVRINDDIGTQSKIVSITCSAAGKAACPKTLGQAMDVDLLPADGSLTFTITAKLASAATGTILNSLRALYYGDPNPNDNVINNDVLVR